MAAWRGLACPMHRRLEGGRVGVDAGEGVGEAVSAVQAVRSKSRRKQMRGSFMGMGVQCLRS